MLSKFSQFVRKYDKVSYNKIISHMMPSIVQIDVETHKDGVIISKSQGSGWVWQNNFIISCRHVFAITDQQVSRIYIKFYDGKQTSGRIVFSDPEVDVAMIQLKEPTNYPNAKYRINDIIEVGELIIALGSGYGYLNSAQTGIFCQKRKDKTQLQFDCFSPPGSSGGLVFNQEGIAIAMIQGHLDPYGFAIPLGIVLKSVTRLITAGHQARVKQLDDLHKLYGIINDDQVLTGFPQSILR